MCSLLWLKVIFKRWCGGIGGNITALQLLSYAFADVMSVSSGFTVFFFTVQNHVAGGLAMLDSGTAGGIFSEGALCWSTQFNYLHEGGYVFSAA